MTEDSPSGDHLATSVRPVGAGRQLAEERSLRSRMLLAARIPPLGGLLGGTFIGLAESLYLSFQAPVTGDWSGHVYAALLYGAVGLAMGLGLACAAVVLTVLRGHPPEPARSWTLSFLAVSGSLAFVIGRFILHRDIFAETAPDRALQLGLLVGLVVSALVFYVVVRNALKKTFFSFLTHVRGTGSVYGLTVAFWLLFGVGTCLENRAELAPRPIPDELAEHPNILFVVVDTLRADALGVYGAPNNPTPRFDAFASKSTVYQDAIAQSPWTRPSFASMLTSTVSCTHQTFRKADTLPDELDTIAEQLQARGYTTGAFVNNINVTASFNFGQGHDSFEFLWPEYPFRASEASFRLTLYQGLRLIWERYLSSDKKVSRYYRDAKEVTDVSTRWLLRHGQSRWFLMVHYMDPHDPYFPHPYDGTGYARVEHPRPELWEAQALADLYAGEVSYWDIHFGRLLDWLEEKGLAENTLVVVTSDHGEEFGEHGGFWHGNRLYDEAIRVPLVLHMPGQPASRLSRDPVRLIDIAPTLADAAGAPHGSQWQGFSLLREYALRDSKDRLALSELDFEGFEARAVRDREWKLIENLRGPEDKPRPESELYFLGNDPGEQQNLSETSEALWALERRRAELLALQAAGCGQAVGQQQIGGDMDAADCEMLRSLGYVDIAEGLCGEQ